MTQLKLSHNTLRVLKNFSEINGSILVREGSRLKTISVGENMIAQYDCEEEFPITFGIYDLRQFITGLDLFPDPTLEFKNNDYVIINGGGRKTKFFFSDPEITIKAAPDRDVNFPESDLSFGLSVGTLLTLKRASMVYGLPDLKITSLDGVITLSLCDRENDTTNTFEEIVPGDSTGDYEFFIKVENLRLAVGDKASSADNTKLYDVKISSKLISQWTNVSSPLTYYIALEP